MQHFTIEYKYLLSKVQFFPLCFPIDINVGDLPQHQSFSYQAKVLVQEGIKDEGAELFLQFRFTNISIASLHLWHKDTGPFTEIHLHDLKGPSESGLLLF